MAEAKTEQLKNNEPIGLDALSALQRHFNSSSSSPSSEASIGLCGYCNKRNCLSLTTGNFSDCNVNFPEAK